MGFDAKGSQVRAAVTVLEMLVVIALVGMLGNLVFSTYLSTAAAMGRLEERNILVEEAALLRKRLCDLFGRNALAAANGPTTGTVWTAEQCAFPVARDADEPGLWLCALGGRRVTTDDSATSIPVIEARWAPMGPEGATSPSETLVTTAPEFSARLTLAYAERIVGLEPVWQDRLPPEARPLLARATIRLASRRFPDLEVEVREVHALGGAGAGPDIGTSPETQLPRAGATTEEARP